MDASRVLLYTGSPSASEIGTRGTCARRLRELQEWALRGIDALLAKATSAPQAQRTQVDHAPQYLAARNHVRTPTQEC